MRRAIIVALVAFWGAALPAAPVRADDTFTFFGSGYGHGIGMSQWGAYGLAKRGWTHQQVLMHFYTATKVQKADLEPKLLRIGLVQGKSRIRLTAQMGQVDLLAENPKGGKPVGTIPVGETWTVEPTSGQYRVTDATGGEVGGHLWGSPTENLYAQYVPHRARVLVTEAGHVYSRGYLEFNLYNCAGGCRLRVILPIAPEPYLYGLGEVPGDWPMQALEAQAVAARTYALFKATTYGQHRPGCNCALYATAADQVYAGWDKEAGVDGNRWVQAVRASSGQVVTYKAELIQAFYSSSSGGYTENNENVWGGAPIAYLRGVCDPGDYTPANPAAVWTSSMTALKVTKRLRLGIGTVTGFSDVLRGVSGRIISATVEGSDGTITVTGDTLREKLGLLSDRVWVNANRNVIGPIREEYDGVNCRPGLPTTTEIPVAGGIRQQFANGIIYFKEGIGAHYLFGPVLDLYTSRGGPKGPLGFPVTDVHRTKDGRTHASFERGTVVCSPSGTCKRS